MPLGLIFFFQWTWAGKKRNVKSSQGLNDYFMSFTSQLKKMAAINLQWLQGSEYSSECVYNNRETGMLMHWISFLISVPKWAHKFR